MSSHEDTPAFTFSYRMDGIDVVHPGMSLRDYFAANAPAVPHDFYIPRPEDSEWSGPSEAEWSDWNVRRAVAWANTYADAMLAARLPVKREERG